MSVLFNHHSFEKDDHQNYLNNTQCNIDKNTLNLTIGYYYHVPLIRNKKRNGELEEGSEGYF